MLFWPQWSSWESNFSKWWQNWSFWEKYLCKVVPGELSRCVKMNCNRTCRRRTDASGAEPAVRVGKCWTLCEWAVRWRWWRLPQTFHNLLLIILDFLLDLVFNRTLQLWFLTQIICYNGIDAQLFIIWCVSISFQGLLVCFSLFPDSFVLCCCLLHCCHDNKLFA